MTAEVREQVAGAFEALKAAYTVGAEDVPDSIFDGTLQKLQAIVEGILERGPFFVMGVEHLRDALDCFDAARLLLAGQSGPAGGSFSKSAG